MSTRRLSRRGFLRGAAVAAAAPAVITSGAATAAPQPSDKVGVGSIGVGGRGRSLLGGFLRVRDCRVLAVADPFKNRRERAAKMVDDRYNAKGCAAYNDYRDLLDRDDIDAVVVATPDHWHVPIAIHAARAGKDSYVEKPLGVCIAWNQACRDAIRRYGRVFQYGTQQRSSGHLRHACELVHNGYIGEIQGIDVVAPGGRSGGSMAPVPVPDGFDYDLWLGPAPVSPYTRDRCTSAGTYFVYENSIGFLGGWGAHPLDIACWGWPPELQVPVEIEGTGTIPADGLFDTVTGWDIRGRYANGMDFTFRHGGNLTVFRGTEGTVWVSRGSLRTEPGSLKTHKLGPNDRRLVQSHSHGGNFIASVQARIDAVSNIDDAVQSDLISHLSDIAIRLGRRVRWDHAAQTIPDDPDAQRMMHRALRSPWTL
ncbi:MAG: Gfo/Idh/MocA family protein [Planctomycetota bacterium]